MAEQIFKELKTRIALRTGDYAYWTTGAGKDIELYKGEVCICTVATADNQATNAPTVLFKVANANGQKFADLNWISGLAADVYSWAKKENPDWTDFPALPLEVVDNGTGKFVTDFTYADNKLTITRSNVAWADIQSKPNLVSSVKVTDDDIVIGTPVNAASGDVTIDIKHKAYDKAGATTDVSGDATTAGSSVTIKVPTLTVDAYGHTEFTGETSHTITIPSEVAVGDGNITITTGDGLAEGGSFNVNQDGDATITLKHADTSNVANVAAADRTYVKSLTFDDFGHVTAVDVGTETVIDTNTAHTHSAGSGLKQTGEGGISGNVLTELNLAFVEDKTNKLLKLVDATDNTKVVASFDTTEFIADGMLASVTPDTANNKLVFEWNTTAGITKTEIEFDQIADIYTGSTGSEVQVAISNQNVVSATLVEVPETKLEEKTQTALALARTALQEHQSLDNYKTKQAAVADQALSGAKVVKGVAQDANGVISVSTRDLTPGDIGAQPAGDYATAVQGGKADTALQEIEAGVGLKVSGKEENKQTIDIDEEVIFILNANF